MTDTDTPTKPNPDISAGMISHYTSLTSDFLRRYMEEHHAPTKKKGELVTPVMIGLVREMDRLAKAGYEISEKKLAPIAERHELGALAIKEGPTIIHHAFTLALGALKSIETLDRLPDEASKLEKGGNLSRGNFGALKSGLFACAQHVAECMGEEMAVTKSYGRAEGPSALSHPLWGRPLGPSVKENAGQLANVLGTVLEAHGCYKKASEPDGTLSDIHGNLRGIYSAVDNAVKRGKANVLKPKL